MPKEANKYLWCPHKQEWFSQRQKKAKCTRCVGNHAGQKWCAYYQHWVKESEFWKGTVSYCKECMKQWKRDKSEKKRRASVAKLVDEVKALRDIISLVFMCENCQSKGYFVNHENKVFICDCRQIARRKLKEMVKR